ncbi:MAG TPA: serine/threonine-protein kinase, partial [Sandaracinaceae bacterium LLY-WYZ-13_1]|nr:serine/threonine-protein kinase [Sandaracinaceae bacterium LLY-WYZ-13_1]
MSEEPAAERVDGRFVLEALAGRGGMGEVWRARDEATGETVALKLLLLTGRLAAARFATEVSLLRDATHANLVRYLAHGEDARRGPWLAMEWIEGTPLDARLERGALSALEALALIGALADGLASLHARGTVHRDLKPENVLLVGDDPTRPKLVDFGVARTSSARHTRPGMVVGTPGYIAPEQIRGEPVDARADVFALGTLLYECLAGRPAFEGEHPLATFTKTLLDEPVPLPALRPDLPSEIADLAHALLAKEPAARPSDAAAVAALLAQAGRGGETVVQVSLPRVGDDERRMVSLLVGQRPMDGGDQTLDDEVVRAERARLLAAAARFGATVEVVTSNSFAVTVPRGPVGTDAPRRAVRCALALGRELPDHAMAVATTRADTSLTGGIADTIERATRLLPSTPGAVAVDDATAALLDGRFVLDEGRADDRLRVVQERAGPPLPR